MIIANGSTKTMTLGQAVTAACSYGQSAASDRASANDLAARNLERVLLRGSNARLIAALTSLARELRPTRPLAQLPFSDALSPRDLTR